MPSGDNIGGIYAQLDLDASQMATALTDAEARTKKAEQAIKDLIADLNAGKIASDQFGAKFSQLTNQFQQAQQQANGLKSAMAGTAASSGAMQQRIQALGYSFQDFTSTSGDLGMKLNSIANNLPMLFAGLGGLGQAIAGAGTAAIVLYRNWDSLMDGMGMGKVKTQAEQMEELAKATKHTADETRRLREYEDRKAIGERIEKARTPKEEEQRKEAEKAIAGLGGEQALKGLVDTYHKDGSNEKMTEQEERDIKILEALVAAQPEGSILDPVIGSAKDALEAKKKEVAERRMKEDRDRAERTIGKAVQDPEQLRELRNRVEKNPEKFAPGFLKDLDDATPEARKAQKALEAQRQQQAARMERERKQDHDLAKQLDGGDVGRKALQGTATEKDVESELDTAGIADAAKKARGAWAALTTQADEAVKARAVERGITQDEARTQLVREHDQRNPETTRLAAPLANGESGRAALKGDLTRNQVRDELRDAGLSEVDAEVKATSVRAKLQADAEEKVRQRASEKAITTAKAREELLAEHDDKDTEVLKRSRALERGKLGREAIAGTVTKEAVATELQKSGESPVEAGKHSEVIADKLNRDAKETVKAKALDEGLTDDEARKRLAREKQERDEQEALTKGKKGGAVGLDDAADRGTVALRLGQATATQLHDYFVDYFKKKGLTDEESESATAGLGKEAAKRVNEKVYQAAQQGPEFKPTRSETFDASSLKDRVQAGVSNEKVLNTIADLQKKQVDYLAKIASGTGIDPYGVNS